MRPCMMPAFWRSAAGRFALAGALLALHTPYAVAVNGPDGATLTRSSKVALADARWMEKAAQAGAAEVEAGKLAAAQSQRDEIRKFGQMMAEQHAKANEELKALAEGKGVVLPASPDAAHKKLLVKLSTLSGAAFDKEYMDKLGRRDHEDAGKLFQQGIDRLKDADLKAYAQRTLSVIKQHFEMTRDIRTP